MNKDTPTTRAEHEALMRHWRATFAQLGQPDRWWRREKGVQDPAWSEAFRALYDKSPAVYWATRPRGVRYDPHPPSKSYQAFAVFNLDLCANSHPHETRNP